MASPEDELDCRTCGVCCREGSDGRILVPVEDIVRWRRIGRADIADYLGLTTETVSRTFTQLKTSGAISLQEGNRIQIADMDGIYDMAEGV